MDDIETGQEVQLFKQIHNDLLRGSREKGKGETETGGNNSKVGSKKEKSMGRQAEEKRSCAQGLIDGRNAPAIEGTISSIENENERLRRLIDDEDRGNLLYKIARTMPQGFSLSLYKWGI